MQGSLVFINNNIFFLSLRNHERSVCGIIICEPLASAAMAAASSSRAKVRFADRRRSSALLESVAYLSENAYKIRLEMYSSKNREMLKTSNARYEIKS